MTVPTEDLWTAVTVTYNSSDHLFANWRDDANVRDFQWIVVDNSSADGSADIASSLGATVVHSGKNLGFSAANNLGLAAVETPNVMFVNPDVRIENNHISDIRTNYGGRECFIAPQLLNLDGTEQPNARGIPTLRQKFANRGISWGEVDTNQYSRTGFPSPTYIAWAMGAAIGGKTETWRRVGGWDDSFFLYYEDHDLGLRGWRRGVPTVLDPSIRWTHGWERATARPDVRAWMREIPSAARFYKKYPWAVTETVAQKSSKAQEIRDLLWTAVPATD